MIDATQASEKNVKDHKKTGGIRHDRDLDDPGGLGEPQQVRTREEFSDLTERECFSNHSDICPCLSFRINISF